MLHNQKAQANVKNAKPSCGVLEYSYMVKHEALCAIVALSQVPKGSRLSTNQQVRFSVPIRTKPVRPRQPTLPIH